MKLKTTLSAVLTVVIFAFILANIDIQELAYHFYTINLVYFSIGMAFFIPIILVNAERWRIVVGGRKDINRKDAIKLTLTGSAFNAIMPSKLGDFSKAYFLKKRGMMNLKQGIFSVIFEKASDMMALCLFVIAGLLMVQEAMLATIPLMAFCVFVVAFVVLTLLLLERIKFLKKAFGFLMKKGRMGEATAEGYTFLRDIKKDKKRLASITFLALFLWLINLSQIYLFFLALGYTAEMHLVYALTPIAILVGMIPVTISGMGTRDSALILLFSQYVSAVPSSLVLGAGIFLSVRYWVPALFGLPFARSYMEKN